MPLQMGKRVSERATRDERRRRAEHGGVGTPHWRGAPGKALEASADKAASFSWRSRARRLVGLVSRRRGGPRWPAGSPPAQWQRPRMWICVVHCAGPRYPSTKPSRGWLRVVVRKPRVVLFEYRATRNKVTAKPTRSYCCRGCRRSVGPSVSWPGWTSRKMHPKKPHLESGFNQRDRAKSAAPPDKKVSLRRRFLFCIFFSCPGLLWFG